MAEAVRLTHTTAAFADSLSADRPADDAGRVAGNPANGHGSSERAICRLQIAGDGYLLDSGDPYRLRFHSRLGIGMKNVVKRYRLKRNCLLHETEEELAAAL